MKKLFLASVLAIVAVVMVQAQTVADAVKDIYYEKYKSAKTKLQQLVSKNPADVDAEYWLGQVYINQDDLAAARSVYARAMPLTNQAPLIMVGMGHVELLEGKAADARAHFDAALSASGKKGDVKVLTAVGRANADGDSKTGDPTYGIDKLNVALQMAQKSNPDMVADIQTLIGISQLKRGPEYGGQAKQAFDAALASDSKNARAKLRIARIFMSQGNKDVFLPRIQEAIDVDPMYAPAYLAQYNYYSRRDVNQAKAALDNYIKYADKDCNTDFFYADYLLQAGQRDAALNEAKKMEANCGADSFPQINLLYAVIYDRNGDSVQARNYIEKYAQKQAPSKLTVNDYNLMTSIYAKFPEDSAKVVESLDKSLSLDTSEAGKLKTLQELAGTFNSQGNFAGEYQARKRAMSIRSDTVAINFYNYINAAINAKAYMDAAELAQTYIQNYPQQPQGYYLWTKATTTYDADTTKGTAIPALDAYIGYLKADSVKNKNRILSYYGYQIYYYVNKAKDYPKAMNVADSILALDPGNAYATQVKQVLDRQMNPTKSAPPAKKASPATKSKTGK